MSVPKSQAIIDASWQMFQKHFWAFAPLIALSLIPGIAAIAAARLPKQAPSTIAIAILIALAFIWIDGAITHMAGHAARDEATSAVDALLVGLGRLGPLVIVGIITQALVAIGILLFWAPAAIAGYLTTLALPAVAVGDEGPVHALKTTFRATTQNLKIMIPAIVLPWIFWNAAIFLASGIVIMIMNAIGGSSWGTQTQLIAPVLIVALIARPLVMFCRVIVYASLAPSP